MKEEYPELSNYMRYYQIFAITLLIIAVYSCKTSPENKSGIEYNTLDAATNNAPVPPQEDDKILDLQKRLEEAAQTFIGKKVNSKVMVNDKDFSLDCIGTVAALYYSIGYDIQKDSWNYSGNGVSRLYESLSDKGLLTQDKTPEVGDIIFWDHTWDRNGDGVIGNDPLTHSGIVVKTEEDGTIHYLHANYYYGIVIEFMNLLHPDVYRDENGKTLNSPLFDGSNSRKHPPKWLAGDLWRDHGRILKPGEYLDYFRIDQ